MLKLDSFYHLHSRSRRCNIRPDVNSSGLFLFNQITYDMKTKDIKNMFSNIFNNTSKEDILEIAAFKTQCKLLWKLTDKGIKRKKIAKALGIHKKDLRLYFTGVYLLNLYQITTLEFKFNIKLI